LEGIEVLSWHLSGGTEEKLRKSLIRIAVVTTEVRTGQVRIKNLRALTSRPVVLNPCVVSLYQKLSEALKRRMLI
jgi:hypothetical protein